MEIFLIWILVYKFSKCVLNWIGFKKLLFLYTGERQTFIVALGLSQFH